MNGQVLSSTVPLHRMYQILLIVFSSWQAGLLPAEGSSALKYRACAQNASDIISSFHMWGGWPAPRWRFKCSLKCSACAQNVSDVIHSAHLRMLVYSGIDGQVLSNPAPAHRMYQMLFMVSKSREAGQLSNEGAIALKYSACAWSV
jgi:hypothetical protein